MGVGVGHLGNRPGHHARGGRAHPAHHHPRSFGRARPAGPRAGRSHRIRRGRRCHGWPAACSGGPTQTVAEGAGGREFAKGTIIEPPLPPGWRCSSSCAGPSTTARPTNDATAGSSCATSSPLRALPSGLRRRDRATARKQRDYLQARVPPFVFEGVIPDPATWRCASGTRHGRAKRRRHPADRDRRLARCGSRTRRVVRDPTDPAALRAGRRPRRAITDPAWTPLFLVASAVVVEVGARLSHAAIVARELGIPAVVSVDRATKRLRDGVPVEVDGTAGAITVLAPAIARRLRYGRPRRQGESDGGNHERRAGARGRGLDLRPDGRRRARRVGRRRAQDRAPRVPAIRSAGSSRRA